MIKLHELVVTTLNNNLPSQVLQIDRNISLMLLPLIVLALAQVPSIIWNNFVAVLGLAPAKSAWIKSSDSKEFKRKFSFDQID